MDIQLYSLLGNKSGVDFGSVENSLAKCPGTKSKQKPQQKKKKKGLTISSLQAPPPPRPRKNPKTQYQSQNLFFGSLS